MRAPQQVAAPARSPGPRQAPQRACRQNPGSAPLPVPWPLPGRGQAQARRVPPSAAARKPLPAARNSKNRGPERRPGARTVQRARRESAWSAWLLKPAFSAAVSFPPASCQKGRKPKAIRELASGRRARRPLTRRSTTGRQRGANEPVNLGRSQARQMGLSVRFSAAFEAKFHRHSDPSVHRFIAATRGDEAPRLDRVQRGAIEHDRTA